MNRILAVLGIAAALCLTAGNLLAQQDNGGNGGGNGGNGGGRRGGGFGRGNFDPAQMQQRFLERIRDDLGFTNDTPEWNAVQPLVQKVMDAQRDVRMGGGFGMRGRNRGNGGQDNGGAPRGGGMFGEPSPEAQALQQALDNNAPTAQVKAALDKYRQSRADKEAKLKAAQDNLRKVLTSRQEAQAVLIGLLN